MTGVGAEDAAQLRNLVAEYAFRVDDGDFDAVVALFAPDATIRSGPNSASGTDEIVGFFERVARIYDWTFHLVGGQTLDAVDGDTVRGQVACRADHGMDGRFVAAAVRYDDVYVRTAAGWRFGHRDLTFAYVAPLDESDAAADPRAAIRWPGREHGPTQWRQLS